MADMNNVSLTGRLTRDPELKFTQSGKAVAKVSLAVGGFKQDDTTFVNLIGWEKLAETMGEYLRKGSRIAVVGKLSIRNYEDENKQKKYVTEVIVRELTFLDSKKEDAATGTNLDNNHTDTADSSQDFPF